MEKVYYDLLTAIENEITHKFIFSIILSIILVISLIGVVIFSKNKTNRIWLFITLAIVIIIAITYSIYIGIVKLNIQKDIDQNCFATYEGEFSFSKVSQSNPEYHSIKIMNDSSSTITLKLYHNDRLKNFYPILGEYITFENGSYCGKVIYAPNSRIVLNIEGFFRAE